MLEDSPCLEHLYLYQDLAPSQHRTIILRESAKLDHPKTLSLWRFTAEEIITSLHSVALPQHGLAMRFVDLRSEDSPFARIYPLDLPPHLSVFTATSLGIQVTQFFCARYPMAFERPAPLHLCGDGSRRSGPFQPCQRAVETGSRGPHKHPPEESQYTTLR
jgi:hypothetical protein